jgi:hypothetical protein
MMAMTDKQTNKQQQTNKQTEVCNSSNSCSGSGCAMRLRGEAECARELTGKENERKCQKSKIQWKIP